MKIALELTPDQVSEIADAVADRLARKRQSAPSLTVAEVAAQLKVSKRTVLRRIEAGVIPKVLGISSVRIPAAWLDAALGKNPEK